MNGIPNAADPADSADATTAAADATTAADPAGARLARLDARVAQLAELSDAALKERFWQLTDEAIAPLMQLARTHTTPSIERSVLLRMGIDSLTSHGVVDRVHERGLLGKGAGHCVLKVSQRDGIDLRAAAAAIAADPAALDGLFEQGSGS